MQQLPSNIVPGTQLFFVGTCIVCGDKYASNATAPQCNSKAAHEKAGKGKVVFGLDRKAISEAGEKRGDKKAK